MSDDIALVRFPNGDLRAALYFGSTDMVVPPLFPAEAANEVLEGGMDGVLERLMEIGEPGSEPSDTEEVEVWSRYGAGAHWAGRASRSLGLLVEGVDPYGNGAAMGGPAEPTRTVTPGTPAWVPDRFRIE